jgi:hypothetical protein
MKQPRSANFYRDENGDPWAIVVHQISADGVSGFGPGQPGEYAKWKIHDTQLPDGEGDAFYLSYECNDWVNYTCDDRYGEAGDPYSEFWPADEEPPACDDINFDDYTPLELDGGNLIHEIERESKWNTIVLVLLVLILLPAERACFAKHMPGYGQRPIWSRRMGDYFRTGSIGHQWVHCEAREEIGAHRRHFAAFMRDGGGPDGSAPL